MRTLVIGDIHGAYKALLQVLELAKITTNDHLIFLEILQTVGVKHQKYMIFLSICRKRIKQQWLKVITMTFVYSFC